MNYKDYFGSYAQKINEHLANHFGKLKKDAERIDPLAVDMWNRLEDFMHGGKRVRGGLIRLGYEAVGGKNPDWVLPVSCAMEITHGSLLIHDDIIDQDDFRHSRQTVHKQYEDFHKDNYKKQNSKHYGQSMAIIVGDLGFYAAISIIAESQFEDKVKIWAVNELAKRIVDTGYGEGLDIDVGSRDTVTEEDIDKINTLKTAHYTFIAPLKLGGILAGATEEQLRKFESYGLPLGIAFQIQDDILGMYGDMEKTGKPNDSDIKEGKNTLLFTQAMKEGNEKQKETLLKLWGKKDISQEELEEARKIIIETGSLDYSKNAAQKFGQEAKIKVSELTDNKDLQEVFLSLADYVIQRES